ncbi:hypothetical protein Tco_1192530 [Tanacetum coccineum]
MGCLQAKYFVLLTESLARLRCPAISCPSSGESQWNRKSHRAFNNVLDRTIKHKKLFHPVRAPALIRDVGVKNGVSSLTRVEKVTGETTG